MPQKIRFLQKLCILTPMLVGLPLLGVVLKGEDPGRYLEFPPLTQHTVHAPFSWTAFILYSLIILAFTAPFIKRLLITKAALPPGEGGAERSFPWWGRVAAVGCAISWVLAWTRFSWFEPLQPFTFLPLWLSFIVVINALTWRRKGSCLLTAHPPSFLALFPFSALFWWFFEYLNRFVQNWHYVNVQDFSPLQYTLHATLAFSTVLPAVLSVREWFLTFPTIQRGFSRFAAIPVGHPRLLAWLMLVVSGAGLALIGIFPNHLFGLLWVSPLIILLALQTLLGEPHLLRGLEHGDWRLFVASALAALFCGWFWEMWNLHSQAKWMYTLPHVERFRIFEMPLLGYAGYLPFGLECAVVGDLVFSLFIRSEGFRTGEAGHAGSS